MFASTMEKEASTANATQIGATLVESPLRSIMKGLTWRVLATITTILIALIITGEAETAMKIGSIEFVAKFLVYYFHERAWARVTLGTALVGNPSED